MSADVLPGWRRVLAVVAHPDDESFGLGALLDAFGSAGAEVSVLCLTRGEASTLGEVEGDLASVRDAELRSAATALGVAHTSSLAHPDGALPAVPDEVLRGDVAAEVRRVAPDGLLVFDLVAGVTGHADHEAASVAAVAVGADLGVPVLGWALPSGVAATLRDETGGGFAGHPLDELTEVAVDRTRQLAAVRCHATQAVPGSVLWRRLELLGDREYVRRLA
ncbi:PIG-L deacetylase family protein [Phycicoccus mangrovi]|uniref:PIG-L deacetylase family protein n=1 Tax=Phycicoccus mangrovi TaxID=2840470 RepID=UPI001D00FAFB|nr:PIG-L deacetylase family protein [Phycicoccus mangrovi]